MVGRQHSAGLAGVAMVVVLAVALGSFWPLLGSPSARGVPSISIRDATVELGPVFHPGVILGAASNGSTTLVGGIGYYVRTPEFSLPALAALTTGPSGVTTENLTPQVAPYFFEGGVYGIGWNGTSWLVGGQASWGGGNYGALVSLTGPSVVNLSGDLHGAFDGGGIFALAWNGTSWLLGGNSTSGIALVALEGNRTVNLTSRLVTYDPLGWIQSLTWNGTAWLICGQGVLGTLESGRYANLWPESPYSGQGAYVAAWNGSAWLIGGGSARLALLEGDSLVPGPALPRGFDQAVLLIAPVAGGWLIGGKGTLSNGGIAPELAYWPGGPAAFDNLTSLVPSSFSGGEIQGGAFSPALGPRSLLLVGDGSYNVSTGHGSGSVAALSWEP